MTPEENLIALWPQIRPVLHCPHNDEDYRRLNELFDRLVADVGENYDHPLASLVEVVALLITDYEDQQAAELN